MEKSTKILLAVGSTLVAGVGGYFIYRAVAKKTENEKLVGNSNKEGSIDAVAPIAPKTLTPEQVGVPTINPASTQPTIPSLATIPTMPSFNLGDFGNVPSEPIPNPTTEYSSQPTPSEYVRMADRYMSWENIWKLGDKLGITDKDKIGGTSASADKGIISTESRKAFGEIVTKFPNWKKLLKDKAKEYNIPISDDNFASSQKYIKDTYGFEMAQFSGSSIKGGNFWTSRR